VKRVLIEEGWIQAELIWALVDRASGLPVSWPAQPGAWNRGSGQVIRSYSARDHSAGGGTATYQARKIAFGLGLPGDVATHATPFFQALYRAFIDTDASLLEINPCVLTGDGKLVDWMPR